MCYNSHMSTALLRDIGVKTSLLRAVEKRAKINGQTLGEYLRALIERDLSAGRSFDEILKPVRAGFKKSGVTEEELDLIVASARKEIHYRNSRKAGR